MTQRDLDDADVKFEQWLLDSGRKEPLSVDLAEGAWKRFAKTSGQVAAGALGLSALSERGARAALAKWAWLGVGVVIGGAGMLAVVERMPSAPHTSATALTGAATTQDAPRERTLPLEPPATVQPAPAAKSQPAPSEAPTTLRAPPPRPVPAAARTTRRASAGNGTGAGADAERRAHGSLAAEVRALDAAREQIEAGRPERALEAITAFQRDFPRAQLAADAEGLAIEALLALGDRAAAARRARRFLHDYPGDPHASRFEPIAADP